MSVDDFLKGLPCHNASSFSLFNTENGIRTSQKRPSVYLATEEQPAEQVIVLEERCILMRLFEEHRLAKEGRQTG